MNVGPSCLIPSSPIPSSPSRRIRIVTFNICGIRNVLQYHPWNVWRNWTMMFDMLDADIICFQETKIQRKDIEESMAIVPGFESFFSFSRYKKGYSGVAVYTRNAVCRPFKAEEGITGCLESCDIGSNGRKASYRELESSIGGYDYLINSSEGQEIDSEGRTVVLDFGKFVLICVYCPANSGGDRSRYRESFLTTLNNRIRQLVEIEMREVVLVGDINIIRDRIDTADPGECVKEGDNTDFKATFARQLLDTLLVPNPTGILVDLCRQYFPQRVGMYTCWNQKINARPGNYGSRLDYLLCTKALSNACSAANILPELLGSDHCPVYGDFQFPIDSAQKITANPEDTPRLAARYFPEFLGRRSIKDMFKTPCPRNSASWRISVQAEQESVGDTVDKSERQLEQAQHLPEPELLRKRKLEPSSTGNSKRSNQQKKLTSFFKQPLSHSGRDVVTDSDDELACDTADCKMFGRENTSVSSAIEKGSRRSPNTVAVST
ncbi:Endonuclease/exonuclease/phosphatase [Lipomyces tetrasporus]|uniref:Endonuclease/exonuclease/phosphatase n=1 Tax=Lipomyces tetrasporus TaxID=54092 RepID=A0AAD7QZS8_9ASCO|nr:Endonuclease/exonuclease/phosphatase [Lipomyces tetrasporus]KAJ8102857.1 Endonuclease/exonuclease/phosphatase [Lipomyces tetrasporus]